MYKFCPHCGKPFVEPEEPRELKLVTQQERVLTWAQVEEWSDKGEASAHFKVGDEIHETLKNGEEVVFVVHGVDMYRPGEVIFGLKDCLKTSHAMNSANTNEGGWTESAMREWLNTEVIDLLPDAMRACITPRSIDGSLNDLWLFSEVEIFGEEYYSENDPDAGKQMPYFKRACNRVKGLGKDGSTCWWWERSPFSSTSTYFCVVATGGDAYYDYASSASGVAFGFCV